MSADCVFTRLFAAYLPGGWRVDQRRGGGDIRRGGPDGEHHLRGPRGRAHGGQDEHHRARHWLPDQGVVVYIFCACSLVGGGAEEKALCR